MATIYSINCEHYQNLPEPQREPELLPCGHQLTFCEKCIQQVKKCPEDGRPIVRGVEWRLQCIRTADGQVWRESSLHRLVRDVSDYRLSSSSLLKMLPSLEDYSDYMQTLVDQPRDVFPQSICRQDYIGLRGAFLKIAEQELDPQTRLQAEYYYAIVEWSQRSPRIALGVQELFGKVAEARTLPLKHLAFSRFTWAYMELNKTDVAAPNYAKALEYLALVETDLHALPVHRAVAKFYMALFFFTGEGEFPQSYECAQKRLTELTGSAFLPEGFKRFSSLMLAEMYIFGLGGFSKAVFSALLLLQDAIQGNQPCILKMVEAKVHYWMGLIYQSGAANVLEDADVALESFKKACKCVGICKQLREKMSVKQMQTSLEKNFRLAGKQRPKYLRDEDALRGPLCERWLSLHLDLILEAPLTPPGDCCVIL